MDTWTVSMFAGAALVAMYVAAMLYTLVIQEQERKVSIGYVSVVTSQGPFHALCNYQFSTSCRLYRMTWRA